MTFKWRGKPLFIRHRTAAEIADCEAVDPATLRLDQTGFLTWILQSNIFF